jgi:hypothetical protein
VAATKLGVINASLVELGNERITDTGEDIKAARETTAVWSDVVAECIASGHWNFAMETIKAAADTGVTPEFGYTEVFAKPSDWVRTSGVSEDEYFANPLINYYDDANFWSADVTPLYFRYVSNDTGLGLDLTRWPAKFSRFVSLEIAERVCLALTQNNSLKENIGKLRDKARKEAKNIDAMDESQPKFRPTGSWTRARWGSSGGSRDRGSRGNLIG